MNISPLMNFFKKNVVEPLSQKGGDACCSARSIGKRIYDAASTAFSGLGNWPFYGVASSFGNRYSKVLGGVLGGCEFSSYFAFRIRNFQEIFQSFFGPSVVSENGQDVHCSTRLKAIAINTGIAALGIIAQFPLMVLTYYGNNENILYPILSGVCESSFTILSLILSFQALTKSSNNDPELEKRCDALVAQVDRFLEELPEKYKNPEFIQQLESIGNNGSEDTLLNLILSAKGLPPIEKGNWDGVWRNIAKGVGVLISCYVTAVNGAVTYQGVKNWQENQEALAISATAFVSLANAYLLTKLCVDSSVNYYEGIRDVLSKQYRPPLAKTVAPVSWVAGRVFANLVSWLSFGTTGTAARDYVPLVGNILMGIAPISSALLLHETLNGTVDDSLLWIHSKCSKRIQMFKSLNQSLLEFKNQIQGVDRKVLSTFMENLPDHMHHIDLKTPLLSAIN